MAETIIINNFTQGGFYVNNGEEYSSSTEIKSGWVDVPGASKITVNSGAFKWSFVCADTNGNFRETSESWGYKDSGTVIDLSAYPWIKSIRIELHDDNGIVPPQTSELVFEFTWYMGDDGLPTTDDFLPFPDNPLADELPKMLWRINPTFNNGLPYHELLPDIRGIDLWAMERENVIRVYDISEPQTGFDHNGLAVLEPTSCTSIHNDTRWDVDLVHPLDEWGKWKFLLVGNVLKIDGQLFRIDSQNPSIDSGGMTMTVHAKHITCDMADMLITFATFPGGNASAFMDFCFSSIEKADLPGYEYYKFEGYSDIQTSVGADELVNTTLWAAMIGADNCLKNRYGGELYRDNFYFSINQRMQYARDNAFCLRYSRDMTRISQKIDYTDFCTNLVCYDNYGNIWGNALIKPNSFVHHPIVRMVQFNYPEFDGAMERLMADGFAYWETVSTPKVTYEVQIAALGCDPKYADFVGLQNYNYGDSGTIYCPELDISTTQRITEIEKDELTGDITRMILGNLRESLVRPTYMGSTISSGRSVEDKQMRAMQNELTQLAFDTSILTPITTIDGKYLTTSDGKYLQYKGE